MKHRLRGNRWNIEGKQNNKMNRWNSAICLIVQPLINERTNRWNKSCVSTTSNNCRKSIDVRIIVGIIWRVLSICCNNTSIKLVPITCTKPTIEQLVWFILRQKLKQRLINQTNTATNSGPKTKTQSRSHVKNINTKYCRPTHKGFAKVLDSDLLLLRNLV